PNIAAFVAVLWLASAAVHVSTAPLGTILTSISPPGLRPLMFGLLGLCFALFGGAFAGVLVGWIVDQAGLRTGLLSMMPVYVVAGVLMARAAATIDDDIDALAADAAMQADSQSRAAAGTAQL